MTCVSSITVSPSYKTLDVGETCYLTAVVCPTNATCKCVNWSSSNSNVATVSPSGIVRAQKAGTVTITATATDGSNVKGTMNLKVPTVSVSSVTLNRSQVTVNKGSSYYLTATVCPSNASNSSLSWCSSNTNVATVINGRVTGVGKGTATITAMAMDGSGKSDTCEVKVKVPVSSISVSSYCNPMKVGDVCSLSVSVYPYDADNRSVCWTSSKANVVTVTSGGIITAKSPGTAIITATATDGSGTHGCAEITVNKVGVTCLRLSKNQLSMDKNTGIELTAWVGPDNATNKSVRWSSSNSRVAEVNNGCVMANDGGTATIKAISEDNSKCFDTCEINVKVPVESITIYYKELRPEALDTHLYVGESQRYESLVLPANATNKCIQWESSNTSVATVTSGGIVTARKAGTATIMAKATDGSGVVGCLSICVEDTIPVRSITISKTCLTMRGETTHQLSATVCPTNATNRGVMWCSSNENVATVKGGKITAKSVGTTTIYCRAQDQSGVFGQCTVTIEPFIQIFPACTTMTVGDTCALFAILVPSSGQTVSWRSSNSNVVEVTFDGKISALKSGNATITATSFGGKASATCSISVKAKPAFDPREEVRIEEDDYGFIIRFKSDRIWKNIGCDLRDDENKSGNPFDLYTDTGSDVSYTKEELRFLSTMYPDLEHSKDPMQFTEDELALIYLFDPLGVEYYMNAFSHTRFSGNTTDHLYFKDRVYKKIFEVNDSHFYFEVKNDVRRYISEEEYGRRSRDEVFSDAEILFGYHNIFTFDLGEFFKNLLKGFLEMIPGVSEMELGTKAYQTLFHTGSVVELYTDTVTNYATEYWTESAKNGVKSMFEKSDHFKKYAKFAGSSVSWALSLLLTLGQAAIDTFEIPNPKDYEVYKKINKSNYKIVYIPTRSSDGVPISMQEIIDRIGGQS